MEMQQFYYDKKIVKKFIYATIIFGVVAMSVGLLEAFFYLFPNLTDGISWLSYGRLRPLHTQELTILLAAIVVAIGFFIAFIRAVKTGQYDDDYTPSVRMLFDDELKIKPNKSIQTIEEKQI